MRDPVRPTQRVEAAFVEHELAVVRVGLGNCTADANMLEPAHIVIQLAGVADPEERDVVGIDKTRATNAERPACLGIVLAPASRDQPRPDGEPKMEYSEQEEV